MLALLASALSGKILPGIVSYAFKDNEVLKLSGDAAISYVQRMAGGYLESRQAQRLIEQIEDEVIEDIGTFLEAEFRAMRNGDKVLVVQETIKLIQSKSFYDTAIQVGLDPRRLISRYDAEIEQIPSRLRIGDTRGAKAISGYVISKFVAIVGLLPTFTRDGLKAILSSAEEILDRLKLVEVELRTLNVKEIHERNEDALLYRQKMRKKLQSIDVFGIDSRGLPKRYDLSIAYVNLSLSAGAEYEGLSSQKVLANAFSGESRLIVVRGEPGSGKTTLLSWLALKIAEGRPPLELSEMKDHIPVFLTLREYSEKELPRGSGLLTEQFGVAANIFREDWLNDCFREGKFAFFIDGFDECPQERRREVSNWIGELLEAYEKCVVVLSARPYAVEDVHDSRLQRVVADFAEISIEPMSAHQIKTFIDSWHSAYVSIAKDDASREKITRSTHKLRERISTSSSLRSLIRNPLICSLICFVNADRDGFVPDQRGELYQLAAETLLERRDVERGVKFSGNVSLTKMQKFKILGVISEYFYQRNSALLPTAQLAVRMKEYLPSLGIDGGEAVAVLQYLAERSHIIRMPTPGSIDFSHKTFLEYFYARRITDLHLVELTSDSFFESDFREVALFAFAVGTAPFVAEVLDCLLKRIQGVRARGGDYTSEILTLQTAIQEASEVSPDARAVARDLLSSVLPPQTQDAAEELAHAGPVILEPLSTFARVEYRKYWEYCVQALINSFEDDAIYSLVPFARLSDHQIDRMIIAARRHFVGEQFRSVLAQECKTVTELEVGDWSELELVPSLRFLKKVVIRDFSDDWDDAAIGLNASVEQLEMVNAYNVTNLDILRSFPNLRSLTVSSGCESLEDYTSISLCPDLRSIKIASLSFEDLDCLRNCRKLEKLDVEECTAILNVKPLNALTRLKELYLPYSSQYDEINLELKDLSVDIDIDYLSSDFGPTRDELALIEAIEGIDTWED
ncbi:NACHT domain-containing protein [Wenxinia marina]|uniref:Putative NTPase (NACHT family) n=1 Tax=Wenxinia marina DSM 24838 TaxID=1123501 RepID=A0A0D0Q3X2_9RHOB|nr:NACHT domain-containing protein [Wenxinia marina]KIQ69189.1 putative NTPase (NACHT family) [Wenxinia marina DSM 24838]GGL71048.1 hypothetical protein GCM10011392_26990 [Wenxinia marina]